MIFFNYRVAATILKKLEEPEVLFSWPRKDKKP